MLFKQMVLNLVYLSLKNTTILVQCMRKLVAGRFVILCASVTMWKQLQVNYLPLSVLVTAFKKESVWRPLEGFGVLVPSKE
jgi:hypothetical protein